MVIMNDLEWSMFSYYVIYLKTSEKYAASREGSFKHTEHPSRWA